MANKMATGKILVIAVAVLAVLTVYQMATFYTSNNYQGDKAANELIYVTNTNDLSQKAYYFQQSLNLLAPYSGNPCWPWPTPDNNYTTIKASLEVAIQNATQWGSLNPSNYAYQQAIPNFNKVADNLQAQIESTTQCQGNNPYINPIGFAWLAVWPIFFISFISIADSIDHYFDNRKSKREEKKREEFQLKMKWEHDKGLHKERSLSGCDVCIGESRASFYNQYGQRR